jgi:GT2 family glycosyltransferase
MIFDFVILNFNDGMEVGRLIQEVESTFSWPHTFTVIDNSLDNRGFGAGVNVGADIGSGDIIVLLNPDIHLTTGWADETIRALIDTENLVIAGPRLDDGYPWPRDVSRNGIKNWVCGACYFVRRSFFERVGGFDERFFFTYEETDLIKQAEDMGFEVRSLNVGRPTIKHDGHRTAFHDQQLSVGNRLYHEKWGYWDAKGNPVV